MPGDGQRVEMEPRRELWFWAKPYCAHRKDHLITRVHPTRIKVMQVKMFRADKMEDLEATVNAWLKKHGEMIDVEYTQTISGSESRDNTKSATFYAVSIWYYDVSKR
jgi:hypothetical protein